MVVLGSALVTVAAGLGVTAYAVSADREAIDPGPEIDYCPATEQIEAHFEEYGLDYKPTVPCGEDEQEVMATPDGDEESVSEDELFAAEREELLSATRAPEADGDPLTMEIVLEDGTKKTIFIEGNPRLFEGMTPAELAELLYPSAEGGSK